MIQQIMVYAIAVAAVLSVAGWGLERLAALQGLPRRSAWILALILSVVLPLVMIRRAEPVRTEVPVLANQSVLLVAEPLAARHAKGGSITPERSTQQPELQPELQPVQQLTQAAPQSHEWRVPRLSDRSLLQAWALASLLSVLYLVGANLRLRRRISNWQHATLLGGPVLISETIGPALVGVFRPRMVIPRWLLDEPVTTQSLILEHERQHIAARDPLLIRATVVLLAALPWNLPLWWQWRRMRQAIELDCDARVLRTGAEAKTYGEVLLAITGRAMRMPVGVIAMSEPVSALERRIENLLPDPVRYAAWQVTGAIALLVAGAGAVFAMDAPSIPARAPAKSVSAEPASAVAEPTTSRPVTIEATPQTAPPRTRTLAAAAPRAGADSAQPNPAAPVTATASGDQMSPRDKALRSAVQQYPELLNAPPQVGLYYVTIVVRADGTIYRSSLLSALSPATYGSEAMADVVNRVLNRRVAELTGSAELPTNPFDRITEDPHTAKIPKGQQIAGMGTAPNDIVANWRVLPVDYDESRDSRRVANVVRAKHADLMLPYNFQSPTTNINLLTVFMTGDGQIARESVQLLENWEYASQHPHPVNSESISDSASDEPYSAFNPPPVPADAFKNLGLGAAQIGQTGFLLVNRDVMDSEGLRRLPADQQREALRPRYVLVRYAWPRRAGEAIGEKAPVTPGPTAQRVQFVPARPTLSARRSSPEDNASRLDKAMRAMAQKYPELISGPEKDGYDSLSMAVTKDGRVIYSGINALSFPTGTLVASIAVLGVIRDPFAASKETAIPDTGLGTAKFPKGMPVGGAGAGKASRNILAQYYMLPADYEESRGIARVANAVRAKHDDLMVAEVALLGPPLLRKFFRTTREDRNALAAHTNTSKWRFEGSQLPREPRDTQIVNLLTVFMTEDGKIAREFVEQKRAEQLQSVLLPLPTGDSTIRMDDSPYNSFNPPPVPAEAFKVLGLEPGQIGATGYVIVHRTGGSPQPFDRMAPPGVVVRYAWPRRPGEPIGGRRQ